MELSGMKVAIVGLARSGLAAAKLCAAHGARVFASDSASPDALAKVLAENENLFEQVQTGTNSVEFLSQADLVVVSPGVPLRIPVLAEIKKLGVPLISEVEFASRLIRVPIVGVTGSNGKTTTTVLIGQMLRESGLTVFVGGNIGTALSELPLSGRAYDVAVVELSSFQLEAIDTFTPHAAGILNITADHLDRYPSFDAYAQTKMNLVASLSAQGVAVLNGRDPQTVRRRDQVKAQVLCFGDPDRPGAYVDGDEIRVDDFSGQACFSLEKFVPMGRHNRENAMAAVLLARCMGATDHGIQQALDNVHPLPHRLEPVRQYRGVEIYNDSKATSPASVATALGSFEAPVVLLLGGQDKDSDFAELNEPIRQRARAVFCFGQAGPKIAGMLDVPCPVTVLNTLEQAVLKGFAACTLGDVLLLSPGCASFDAFDNYIHRGERFKECVDEL